MKQNKITIIEKQTHKNNRISASKEIHKYYCVVNIVSKPTENPFVQKFGCHLSKPNKK